jgi:hypothetical protein
VFPVRYELNSYILLKRNTVFKGLRRKHLDVGDMGPILEGMKAGQRPKHKDKCRGQYEHCGTIRNGCHRRTERPRWSGGNGSMPVSFSARAALRREQCDRVSCMTQEM